MPKVFIIKYALTKGIIEVDAELVRSTSSDRVTYANVKRRDFAVFTQDFRLNGQDAWEAAEARRLRKIKSLKQQIAKLEVLKIRTVQK